MFHCCYIFHSLLIVYLVGLVKLVHGASNPNVEPGSFCYDDAICDQSTWPGLCNSGTNQSPINVEINPFKPYWAPVTKFELNKNYATEIVHTFFGQNNGHTAQFDLNPNLTALTSELEIGGGGLGATYKFAQLHFHWSQNESMGSEHQINGQSYPLEMHVVHYKTIYASLADALSPTNNDSTAVAVMAVFFKISLLNSEPLQPLVQALAELEDPGMLIEYNLSLKISDLYPPKMEFARYFGSLTTPTCDEKVVWTIFLRPVGISKDQMAAFRHLTNEEELSSFNYRKTQALNDRRVWFYRGIFKFDPFLTFIRPFPFTDLLNTVFYLYKNLFNYFRPYLLILPFAI